MNYKAMTFALLACLMISNISYYYGNRRASNWTYSNITNSVWLMLPVTNGLPGQIMAQGTNNQMYWKDQ